MENPFEFHEEDTIIACVGDNGGTTDEDMTKLQLLMTKLDCKETSSKNRRIIS